MSICDQILGYEANKNILGMDALNHMDASLYFMGKERNVLRKVQRFAELFVNTIKYLAFSVAAALTQKVFFSSKKVTLLQQIEKDKALLQRKERRVALKALTIIKKEKLFQGLPDEEVKVAVDVAKATYAVTKKQFNPIIIEWTKSLLQRAKENNQTLLFMARDGLGPYEIAKALQKKNPEFAEVPLRYIYLSRKIVQGDKNFLNEYLQQEGITKEEVGKGKKFLFIDIGFLGSMIPTIRSALSDIGIQDEKSIDFEFCISTGDKVRGFVGDLTSLLRSVQSASKNRGVYWLEDTHQGCLESPKKLLKVGASIVPNTVHEKSTCKTRNELDFLLKSIALKAIEDSVKSCAKMKGRDSSKIRVSEESKKVFDEFIHHVKTDRFLYVDHT